MTCAEVKEQMTNSPLPAKVWVEEDGLWLLKEVKEVEVHPNGGVTLSL